MTRAVLDTNVLIAGILTPAGSPAALLRSWRRGEFDIVLSPASIEELRRALGYPKIRKRVSEDDGGRFVDSLVRATIMVPDPDQIPPISRDPADDFMFELTRSFADVLVTGDKDILEVTDPPVRVLTPAGFAEILRTRWN